MSRPYLTGSTDCFGTRKWEEAKIVKDKKLSSDERIARLRLPEEDEVLGIVEQRLGAGHLKVRCKDGRMRTCRIPGRLYKRMWISEGDLIIVEPWQVQSDERGDVIYRYKKTQAKLLLKKGLWKEVE